MVQIDCPYCNSKNDVPNISTISGFGTIICGEDLKEGCKRRIFIQWVHENPKIQVFKLVHGEKNGSNK
tara:strand:+ start:554 stop:757 length:204 start_codon:yes stop_codon:yes gene_type:complete